MKATLLSAALLAAICAACCISLHYTKTTTGDILDSLDMCRDAVAVDDWELALDTAQLASALWHNSRPLYSTFLRHTELSEITCGLSRAVTLATLCSRDDLTAELGELSELIELMAGFDRPTIENLF